MRLSHGKMGISPREFEQYTWHEFLMAAEGYLEKETLELRMQRELIFRVAAHSMNPPKGVTKASDLWELPGDKEKGSILSETDIKSALHALRKENGKL